MVWFPECQIFWVRSQLSKERVGIKGFPPLDLVVREDFLASHNMRARPINPRLFGHTEKEFKRLLT